MQNRFCACQLFFFFFRFLHKGEGRRETERIYAIAERRHSGSPAMGRRTRSLSFNRLKYSLRGPRTKRGEMGGGEGVNEIYDDATCQRRRLVVGWRADGKPVHLTLCVSETRIPRLGYKQYKYVTCTPHKVPTTRSVRRALSQGSDRR